MINRELLNSIRDLEAEVTGLKDKAKVYRSRCDDIYARISEAEGYRFASLSRYFSTPEGPCPLTSDEESKLRKEYQNHNEAYQKLVVTIGKKERSLNKKRDRLTRSAGELAEYINELHDKIQEMGDHANSWAKAYERLDSKKPSVKIMYAVIDLMILPLMFLAWCSRKIGRIPPWNEER